MDIRSLYLEMLEVMDSAFCTLVASVEPPQPTYIAGGFQYRYRDQNETNAVILKLAKIQSGLRAALVLHESGYVLEQGALSRMVDEASDDVLFLALAVHDDEAKPRLSQFLESFWQEEFTTEDMVASHQPRRTPPRDKIRAAINRMSGEGDRTSKLGEVIHKMYSGFVHGAAPHIMEMYIGDPPSFRTHGLIGTLRMSEFADDLWNPMYRALLSHIFAAQMFGADKVADSLNTKRRGFLRAMGLDYGA